ncbi:MAG TPA: DMT family transporter [Flavisolibacter sp.]|nr:DMT family transporter [Flavisolibacter sp.]
MKTTTKAHIAVLLTNLFFAANYSLVKMISPSLVKPFALNLLRVGLSLVLFWSAWLLGRSSARIRKKDWGRFIWCGLTGVAINQMLFIKGLTLTSTIHASLLSLVTPLLVTLFALWVLKERFTIYKALGLSLGIGGSVFLILQKEASHEATNYLLGDVLIVINAISYAVYFILVKPLMQHYSPLQVIRWVFTIGFFMILPFGWQQTLEINWTSFQWQHYVALFGVVVTGTFLAYYFNAYGIQHIGAGNAGSYIYTQLVFAVLIATLILGETLTWQKLVSACLIFAGVYLVSFRKEKTA